MKSTKEIGKIACGIVALAFSLNMEAQTISTTENVIVSLRGGAQMKEKLAQEHAKGQGLGLAKRQALTDEISNGNKMRATNLARKLGITVDQIYGSAFVGFSAQVTAAQMAALKQEPQVESISPNHAMQGAAQGKPGGGGGSTAQVVPWGVTRIGAAGAINRGAGIHVFVVDSGIDLDHPDLAANIVDGYAVVACKTAAGVTCHATWDDDYGHGSHVAGTIAAVDNSVGVIGVAPDAKLHAVKVLDARGNTDAAKVAAGMDYVTQRSLALGVSVVANVSIGGYGSKVGYCDATGYHGSDNYARAFCEAANAGVIVSVSAGNYHVDARGFLPSTYDDAVIAVSAAWGGPASPNGDWWWNDSNWGVESAPWNPRPSAPVALGAPGYLVLSTVNTEKGSYAEYTGTSMAAPHVAGAIALFLKKYPQGNSYAAFTTMRQLLLNVSTSTTGFYNTSAYSHTENYLNVLPVR